MSSIFIFSRPLAKVHNGEATVKVMHFDYLYSGGAEGLGVYSEDTYMHYLLVMVEDVSDLVWLEPAQLCTCTYRHRASPDGMLCPIRAPERLGQIVLSAYRIWCHVSAGGRVGLPPPCHGRAFDVDKWEGATLKPGEIIPTDACRY